ncbi:MAG: adenylosuccinate lyase [Candidatus Tectomicrobia bacterium]|nr:adenylosuccinate lyase [Candidatus Tectomicrobia bacterium]
MEQNRYDEYQSPLTERYVTREMNEIFSPNRKFRTWRRLWIALAEAECELGLSISQKQIEEMKRFQDEINYEEAERKELEIRHDVMAHIYAFGLQCPGAKGIIHLGATSAYVVDNTDLILMRDALMILRARLVNIIDALGDFAAEYKALPTLSFTHFQPAQLTTVGKRATLWIQDLLLDLEELEYRLDHLRFLGVKGTTGTQESFMKLFDGDEEKVKKLEELVAEKMEFREFFPVAGQTYPRKIDSQILSILSGIAQSAHKFSNDLRLLQHLKEIEEPFEDEQVGSSAMAYKRNPMRCERIAGLARHLLCNSLNPALTSATQWFERTLDDSANKRLSVPEAFMVADGLLNIYLNVAQGLVVYPKMVRRHIEQELPFMATEEILMEAAKAGGDRQFLHERIRRHAMEAGRVVKEEGGENDLLRRVMEDPAFARIKGRIPDLLDPIKFVGRAPQQVQEFLDHFVEPIRSRYRDLLGLSAELKV